LAAALASGVALPLLQALSPALAAAAQLALSFGCHARSMYNAPPGPASRGSPA
jgi:hypothetical protein